MSDQRIDKRDDRNGTDAQGNGTHDGHYIHIDTANLIAQTNRARGSARLQSLTDIRVPCAKTIKAVSNYQPLSSSRPSNLPRCDC